MIALSPQEIADSVREVTDEEVGQYHEQGWVMLRSLIPPDVARLLLESAAAQVEAARAGSAMALERREPPFSREVAEEVNRMHTVVLRDADDPFHALVLSPRAGLAAQRLSNQARLTGVPGAMRYHTGFVGRKPAGAGGTLYHQDSTEEGPDRAGALMFWLALDEVTPEMGAMRFVTGAHREGPLGMVMHEASNGKDLLEQLPKLTELYELSPPFHYQPGDATVHAGYAIHGAPPNSTERDRWAYIFGYIPAETRYINGKSVRPEIERRPPDDADCPVVYPAG
jgi:ectoine hydroxylase-related dioxygenase (phytanoyl-CoA dioxygenase family)